MRRGIVIPAVNFMPIEERQFDGLQHYQDAVGGYIEPISINEPPLTIYVNEEGKGRRMSFNERATLLWWLFEPRVRGHDLVAGDAVVVVDDPDTAVETLQLAPRENGYCVEVQLAEARGLWVAGERRFGSWFEAARFALALDNRFAFVAGVRVAAA